MSAQPAVNNVFKAVAHPARREIFHLLMLADSPLSLTQISDRFDMTRQGITKHIKLMEEAGLIKTTAQGRERFCEADPTPLNEIKNWLAVYDRFWDDKIQSLDNYLR